MNMIGGISMLFVFTHVQIGYSLFTVPPKSRVASICLTETIDNGKIVVDAEEDGKGMTLCDKGYEPQKEHGSVWCVDGQWKPSLACVRSLERVDLHEDDISESKNRMIQPVDDRLRLNKTVGNRDNSIIHHGFGGMKNNNKRDLTRITTGNEFPEPLPFKVKFETTEVILDRIKRESTVDEESATSFRGTDIEKTPIGNDVTHGEELAEEQTLDSYNGDHRVTMAINSTSNETSQPADNKDSSLTSVPTQHTDVSDTQNSVTTGKITSDSNVKKILTEDHHNQDGSDRTTRSNQDAVNSPWKAISIVAICIVVVVVAIVIIACYAVTKIQSRRVGESVWIKKTDDTTKGNPVVISMKSVVETTESQEAKSNNAKELEASSTNTHNDTPVVPTTTPAAEATVATTTTLEKNETAVSTLPQDPTKEQQTNAGTELPMNQREASTTTPGLNLPPPPESLMTDSENAGEVESKEMAKEVSK